MDMTTDGRYRVLGRPRDPDELLLISVDDDGDHPLDAFEPTYVDTGSLTDAADATATADIADDVDALRRGMLVDATLEWIDGDPEDYTHFTDLYDTVQPFDEASDALERQQQYAEVWTFSNVESRYLEMMVDKLDMEPDYVGTMEDIEAIKPSPYAYRTVLEQNGYTADEVLYCAAPIFDVNGAMAYGMQCAYLNRPEQAWQDPQRDPQYVISDLTELADMLEDGEISAPERSGPGRRAE